MRAHPVREIFAFAVSVPLFLFLAWFFGIFMNPQGGLGAGFAAGLTLLSAIAALWVHAWIRKPGPKLRFRNRGVDGFDRDWGVGMAGYSSRQDKRRRDETDGDDLGGRRSSGDAGEEADGLEDGSPA